MLATINENGFLIITPENGLEMYALSEWSKGYFVDNDKQPKTGIIVNRYEEKYTAVGQGK
jgi:hypothetical protein